MHFNLKVQCKNHTHTYLDSKTWCAVIVHYYYIIALKLCSTSFQLMQGKNQLRPTQISTLQNEPGLLSFLFLLLKRIMLLFAIDNQLLICSWQTCHFLTSGILCPTVYERSKSWEIYVY